MTMTNDSSSILVITTSSHTSVIDKAPVGVVGDNDNNHTSTALAAVTSTQEQFNRAASLDQDFPANKYHHDKEEEQELEFAKFLAMMKFSSFHDEDEDDEDDANKTRNNQVTRDDVNDGSVIRPMPFRVRAAGGKQMANYNVEKNHVNCHSTPPPPSPQAAFAAVGGHTIPSFPGKEAEGGGEGNHYVRKTPSGQEDKTSNTSIMLMTMMSSNAKFSPIVWRTFNTDLRGPHAGPRHHASIYPPLAPVGVVATGTSRFETIHDTTATTTTVVVHPPKAERDEEIVVVQDQPPTYKNLPPIPSPPSTRLPSKQSAGPPKIPTLKKKGDDETTTITSSALLFHSNNINQGNENKEDDDEEVAGITSCIKRGSDNHAVVKSPSLVPRKRSLDCHHDDTPTPQSCTEGSSSICGGITGRPICFDVSLLPTSSKYWIPPRRPTKRSRLFLIDQPHDEDDQKQGVNDQGKGAGDQDEIMDNDHVHDHPKEGSVATFSLSSSSSSSSSGLSIATPHSCPSPTMFSIHSSSAVISSAVATSIIATPAAATHSLEVQFVIVPKFANDIVASEEKSEGAPTNLFFTPPRSEV